MRFGFTEDQKLFGETVAEMLAKECTPESVRAAWDAENGRVVGLWSQLAEMGVVGAMAPESAGGLGFDEVDAALIVEAFGKYGAPEPVIETMCVAIPTLAGCSGERAESLLAKACAGEATASFVDRAGRAGFASDADAFLAFEGDRVFLLDRDDVELAALESVDGSRRLARVTWTPDASKCVAEGEAGAELAALAAERATLAASLMLVGLGRFMLNMAVEYAKVREQFGKPIGAQQAVKHHLANALIQLEFARPPVMRAAHSLANRSPRAAIDVSMGKAFASEAAIAVSKVALQVHGGMGYSFEYDLHLFMKRAWALARAHGDAAWHRERVAKALLDTHDAPAWDYLQITSLA